MYVGLAKDLWILTNTYIERLNLPQIRDEVAVRSWHLGINAS